jgi:hypothetical protein
MAKNRDMNANMDEKLRSNRVVEGTTPIET